jgi:fructosamine-3-kinase
MMRLFGGFPKVFWQAYQALYPIPEEVEEALPQYQVYYLLAHVHFFGKGYLGSLWKAISAS